MHNGKPLLLCEIAHHLFRQVEHGADLRHAGAVEIRHGLKAAQPAFKKQAHQEGLHGVVMMMPQRDLFEALLQKRLIQRPAAHLCAHGAGILFLPVVKNHRADLRDDTAVRHAETAAVFLHRAEIHARQPHVDGNGRQLVGPRIVFPQRRQQRQKRQRILAAGNADGDLIVGLYHAVVVNAAPHQTHHSLHLARSPHKSVFCLLSISEKTGEKQRIREFSRRKMNF